MKQKSYGIVGGGVMGMTLALRLAQKGHKVTIFESGPELGGLASSWKMNEVEWDKFYHVILLSDFYTRNLLTEIGVEKDIRWVETKTGFYIDGKLYSISNIIEFLKFPTLNLWDKFRLGITIVAASKIQNWKRLEQVTVTEWLKKWSGNKTYKQIWLPLLRAKLGNSYKKTSAVFIWATIQRLYGARRSGLKKEMFGYVAGGYKSVIEAFKNTLISLDVDILTKTSVTEVTGSGNGKVNIHTCNNNKNEYDNVIVTLPSALAEKVCTGLTTFESQRLKEIEYLGVICVSVLLKDSISDYYVTNITDSRVPFTGVIEMTALINKQEMSGKSLVYLPKYVTENDPMFEKSDHEIRTYFTESLLRMYPHLAAESIEFTGVARAKHVITVAKLNYSDTLPEIKTTVPGLYIVNTAQIKDGTLNVNETVKVAETKLGVILRQQEREE